MVITYQFTFILIWAHVGRKCAQISIIIITKSISKLNRKWRASKARPICTQCYHFNSTLPAHDQRLASNLHSVYVICTMT